MKIKIINGPNLNMLGIREPDIYGRQTYRDLEKYLAESLRELGLEGDVFQSNHEGALVDAIQDCYGKYDAIVINPAAYTHTSVAILDALKAVALPAVEVHLSDVQSREEFRQVSYSAMACLTVVAGHGFEGYKMALELLVGHLKDGKNQK